MLNVIHQVPTSLSTLKLPLSSSRKVSSVNAFLRPVLDNCLSTAFTPSVTLSWKILKGAALILQPFRSPRSAAVNESVPPLWYDEHNDETTTTTFPISNWNLLLCSAASEKNAKNTHLLARCVCCCCWLLLRNWKKWEIQPTTNKRWMEGSLISTIIFLRDTEAEAEQLFVPWWSWGLCAIPQCWPVASKRNTVAWDLLGGVGHAIVVLFMYYPARKQRTKDFKTIY